VREQLRRVYWIGGGSGAGKSTVARRLVAGHGFTLYATDDVMADHARRTTPEESPLLARFIGMTMDERWVKRTPATMLETFHWFRGEAFHLIIEDLLELPAGLPVVAEGFRLLPRLVEPFLAEPRHAVWLLPSPRFRRAALESRDLWAIGGKTTDPALALCKLLDRERMFTDELREETRRLGLQAIEVDTTMGRGALMDLVVERLGL
jgi:2-phosphoglycerate kinase